MSAGFTPGPWTFEIYDPNSPREQGDTFFLGQVDDENGGIYGTILEGGLVLASDEENEANANLIAAAPDLYAALEFYADEWKPTSAAAVASLGHAVPPVVITNALACDYGERAKAALAKARGEQVPE